MTIENQVITILKEAAEYWEVKLMLDYSGRGMMGRECVGIISKYEGSDEGKDLAEYLDRKARELITQPDANKALIKKLNAVANKLRKKPSVDNFGRGYINYFKTLKV